MLRKPVPVSINPGRVLPSHSSLSSRGRRSIEQGAVPGTNNRVYFGYRDRCGSADENNGWSNYSDRGSRMHRHADRTMIRIGRRRMNVRHLHKRDQRKQEQADKRSHAHTQRAAHITSAMSSLIGHLRRSHRYFIRIHRFNIRRTGCQQSTKAISATSQRHCAALPGMKHKLFNSGKQPSNCLIV